MSRQPESKFVDKVHKDLDYRIYHQKTRGVYSNGCPDMYYEGNRAIMWIEYKWFAKLPEYINLWDIHAKPCLSALQQAWLKRANANGVKSGVAAGHPDGVIWLPGVSWLASHESKGMTKFTVKEFQDIIARKVVKDDS